MTLHEQVIRLAQEKYPDVDMTTRIIPTLSKTVQVMDVIEPETITMDWLDATGQPMMGWGPKANTLIVHRSVIALLRADVGPKEMK